MALTTAQIEDLKRQSAEIKKAHAAQNLPVAEELAKKLAERSTALHTDVTPLVETEVDSFYSKHMGTHGPNREEMVAFQKAADDCCLLGTVLGYIRYDSRNEDAPPTVSPNIRMMKTFRALQRHFPKLCQEGAQFAKRLDTNVLAKALYSTGTALGDEWVPTTHSPRLTEDIHLATKIAALIERVQMPAPTYVLPILGSMPKWKKLSEATTDSPSQITKSDPGTASITLTAQKAGFATAFSEEFSEDSIVPVLPMLRRRLIQASAHGLDSAVLNGDTTNPHQDSDVDASTHGDRLWKGLRKQVLAAASISSSSFAIAELRNVRANMGKYGASPDKLAYITSPAGYMRMLGLAGVATLDVFGPKATILTGQLANVDGAPVIVSEDARQDLNASGVYDGTTKTKTAIVVVFRDGWVLGERRGITVKMFQDPRLDQDQMIVTWRGDFQPLFTATTEGLSGQLYNIANTA